MKIRKLAGFALLLSIIMLGAFISGCIDQGDVTRTVTNGSTTVTPTASTNEWKAKEEKLTSLIATYDGEIANEKENLAKIGFELESSEIGNWEAGSRELLEMAESESDPRTRVLILQDVAKLKYYELLNLRTLAGIGALEKTYWENATTGEPIEAFYSPRGEFFYIDEKGITPMNTGEMVETMYSLLRGYKLESLEIYHLGTGSTLRTIREGGRTVGAGQVAVRIGAKNGKWLKAVGESTPPVLKLVDPETGETVARVRPDENGFYLIPPVNTTLLGIPDDDGFCYRPLPLDTNTMNTIPEEPEDPLICPSPEISPFIFEPTDTGSADPVPLEEAYIMPGEYTVTILVTKADLKQLAEQLVNINVKIGGEKTYIKTPQRTSDAFQKAVTGTLVVNMSTQPETTCSCTFSPLLRSVFGRAFGGEPFGEVPEPGVINITDYGNGPYIPVEWEMLENYSSVVTVYVITNSNGETLIAIGDPGVNQGMKKPSAKRLAPSYLDRVFVEIFTGRNPQTGKEIKIPVFKVLNTDGTVGIRATGLLRSVNVRVAVFPTDGIDNDCNGSCGKE